MRARKQKTSRGPRRQQGMQVISHPPPIQEYAVRHSTRLRFVTNAAFVGNITFQNLLDTMITAITAVLGYDQFFAVKVRGVEVWADAVAGNASSVLVQFAGITGASFGDQRLHTDTSMGIQPAHVKCRPAPKTLAANFQSSTAAEAFHLEVPSGAVVDVELTFVQSALIQATAAQNALVGATIGAPYWRGLDGVATAASKFVPVTPSVSVI